MAVISLYEIQLAKMHRDEMIREAEKERLIRLVTENLKRHGSKLLSGKPGDKQPKPSKN